MADQLVIRYYPVDGEFSYNEARYNYGYFGLGLWVQVGEPPFFDYDADRPTMIVPTSTGHPVGFPDQGWMTVKSLNPRGLVEGQYVEYEIQLTTPDGFLVPLTTASFPLEVIVAAGGSWSDPGVDGKPYRNDYFENYAGGALEFGFYDASNVYYSLASVWVDGFYFEPKTDGTSYDNPALPPMTRARLSVDSNGLLHATLDSGVIPPAFWTQLRKVNETP